MLGLKSNHVIKRGPTGISVLTGDCIWMTALTHQPDEENQRPISIQRCHITSVGILKLKIWSLDRLISKMWIPISWKDGLYLETGPSELFHQRIFHHNSDSMDQNFNVIPFWLWFRNHFVLMPRLHRCRVMYKTLKRSDIEIWMKANKYFNYIWIVMESVLARWAPGGMHETHII